MFAWQLIAPVALAALAELVAFAEPAAAVDVESGALVALVLAESIARAVWPEFGSIGIIAESESESEFEGKSTGFGNIVEVGLVAQVLVEAVVVGGAEAVSSCPSQVGPYRRRRRRTSCWA